MHSYSDEELIEMVAGGDKRAFTTLSKRYSKSLYGVVYRMFYSFNMAEDVTQEVMIKVWKKAYSWDGSKGSVFSWIYKIAVNHCLDEKRKQKKATLTNIVSDEQFASQDRPQDEVLQHNQEKERIKKELSTLPKRQRLAIILFFFEGLKMKEISKIMDCTEKAVENLLLRGKKTLKERVS